MGVPILERPPLVMGLNHDLVRQPPLFKNHLPALYWWHERGRLHWEDPQNNKYNSISVAEACERLEALGTIIKNGERDANKIYPDEVKAMRRFIDEFRNLIRLAKEHGDINSPGMLEDVRRRKKKSVSVPGRISAGLADLQL